MGGLTSDNRARSFDIGAQFRKLYNTRMPVLKDYEKFVQTQLDTLIGETVPAARDLFRQSIGFSEQYANEVAPAISKYMKDAEGYDTPERREVERGKAMTDVRVAGDASRNAALQRLESFGIDPSVTRGAALDAGLRLETALAQVKAGQDAENRVEETGNARRRDAIQVGSSLMDASQAGLRTGSAMLENNVAAGNSTANNFAGIFGTPGQNLTGRAGANQAMLDAKLAEETADAAARASKGAGLAGIGQAVGTIGGTALGAYFGGPAGAKLGAQIGGSVGGSAAGGGGGGLTL